jgi:glucosamine-6-phosphate deaminase
MMRRAIIWLSQLRKKAILKLTDDDYNEAGPPGPAPDPGLGLRGEPGGLLPAPAHDHRLAGRPRPGAHQARRRPGPPAPRPSAGVFPKRILVLSPHPDDDVIGMGGTLCRLVEHGHEVHVAYQVSGANAVSDEALARALGLSGTPARRPPRARAPARPLRRPRGRGLAARDPRDPALEGPRPPPGGARRRPGLRRPLRAAPFPRPALLPREPRQAPSAGEADRAIMRDLLGEMSPTSSSPRATSTTRTARTACASTRCGTAWPSCPAEAWVRESELWLYRGAWSEWSADEIDMAVPLSPQEVLAPPPGDLLPRDPEGHGALLG